MINLARLQDFASKLEISYRTNETAFIHTTLDCNDPEWSTITDHLNNLRIGSEWPVEILAIIDDIVERASWVSDEYELEDQLFEIADSNVSIYYHELAKWAFDNHDIINELLEESAILDYNNFDLYRVYKIAMHEYYYRLTRDLFSQFVQEQE